MTDLQVLHVLPSVGRAFGGPAECVVGLASALESNSIHAPIVTTTLAGPPQGREHHEIVESDLPAGTTELSVTFAPLRPPARLAYAPRLHEAVVRQLESHRGSSVVHIHTLWLYPQFTAFRAALAVGVPYVVSPRGALDPWLRARGRTRKAIANLVWQTRMLRGASVLHFTTDEESRLASDVTNAQQHWIAPNGIRLSRWKALGEGRRFRNRFLDGAPNRFMFSHSRITKKKGYDRLIAALGSLPSDVMLVIAGGDEERLGERLMNLAACHGVLDRVRLLGPLTQPDLVDGLAACQLWVLPSHTENFGNAVLEAMAAGVPCAIGSGVNLAAAARQAKAARVVGPSDSELAQVLREMITDDTLREKNAEAAQRFAGRYEWDRVIKSYIRLYCDVALR